MTFANLNLKTSDLEPNLLSELESGGSVFRTGSGRRGAGGEGKRAGSAEISVAAQNPLKTSAQAAL